MLRSISTAERYHYFCIGYSTKNITLLRLYDLKMQLMIGSVAHFGQHYFFSALGYFLHKTVAGHCCHSVGA